MAFNIRSVDNHPVKVNFTINGEPQTLDLIVKCMTPKAMLEYAKELDKDENTFFDLIRANGSVIGGWENVFDEDGNPVEYSPERLEDLQYDYFGLADSIAVAITNESTEVRAKNLSSSVSSVPRKPKNKALPANQDSRSS